MNLLTLAWRPFLDPLDLHGWWFLFLVPLALGMSVAYKAVRLATLERYWVQVLTMTLQIVFGIIGLGALSYVLLDLVAPRLIPMGM